MTIGSLEDFGYTVNYSAADGYNIPGLPPPPPPPPPPAPSLWTIDGTGDFDGDGKSDILWHNDAGGATSCGR